MKERKHMAKRMCNVYKLILTVIN